MDPENQYFDHAIQQAYLQHKGNRDLRPWVTLAFHQSLCSHDQICYQTISFHFEMTMNRCHASQQLTAIFIILERVGEIRPFD